MTAPVDFAALPPEINSARMYSGAGPGPMLAAAAAWHGLAAELHVTALSYSSVLGELLNQQWSGPASASMAAAVTPYVLWLSATSAQAEETAAQAEAAVAAYEAAFAATVPPPVIAANRALLMMLVATNFLGQNTPAIAATEAQYAEMWAQDAAAMYGYAASSAAASELTSFTEPAQIANPGAIPAQSVAVTQAAATSAGTGQTTVSELMSALPGALQSLASPTATETGLGGILDGLNIFTPGSGSSTSGLAGLLNSFSGLSGSSAFGQLLNANIFNTIFGSGFYMPGFFAGTAADFMGLSGKGAGGAIGEAVGPVAGAAANPLGSVGSLGNSVSAGFGRAGMIGPLSVPPSWATPSAPVHSPLAAAMGSEPIAAPQSSAAGTPPVPMGANLGAQGEGRAVPQYGFRPNFVARPPAAG